MPSDTTCLWIDFENIDFGKWDSLFSFKGLFEYSKAEGDEYNLSKGSLRINVPEGEEAAGICFDLVKNGFSPIPVMPSTRVAWSWYITEHKENTNGFWMVLQFRDRRTGKIDVVRCVSRCESDFDLLCRYEDPDRTWIYHEEQIFPNIDWRNGPFVPGDIVIESIGFGAARAAGMDARIDNVWIGEGCAPHEINTIDLKKQNVQNGEFPFKGFSFGYIDGDDTPDRVDLYGNRMEIVPGSFCKTNDAAGGSVADDRSRGAAKRTMNPVYWGMARSPNSASIVDLDDDGQDDILVHFVDERGNRFYKNEMKKGKLEDLNGVDDALEYARQKFYGSAAADMDSDGDIDLFLINPMNQRRNYGGVRLLRNGGGGGWSEWTDSSGVLMKNAFGAVFSDLDGDGDQDLFIPYRAYRLDERPGRRPYLNLNDGRGGFTFVPSRINLSDSLHIEGAVAADFDNDADIDLYVVVRQKGLTSSDQVPGTNIMLLNDGSGYFIESPVSAGSGEPRMSQAALAEDFDQDGDIDIYEINDRNHCVFYRNNGNGFSPGDSMHTDFIYNGMVVGGLAVDYDTDGDTDIILYDQDKEEPQILSNGSARGGFLQVRLHGIRGNSAGIGAKVYVYESGFIGQSGKLAMFREVRAERGFGMHGPPVAHFGLGEWGSVDVLVIFPMVDGKAPVRVERRGVPANSFLYIPETNDVAARLWYSWRAVRARYLLSRVIFAVPGGPASLLLFLILSFAGHNIRRRFDRTMLGGCAVRGAWLWVLASAAVLILAAALFRSWIWSVPAVLASALMVGANPDIGRLTGRLFGLEYYREDEEKNIVEIQSHIIHAEEQFKFLYTFTNVDASTVEKYGSEVNPGLVEIDRCIRRTRKAIPNEGCWKNAAREFYSLKEIFLEYLREGTKDKDSLSNDLKERIGSFIDSLRECRKVLRKRYSVVFADEWRKLLDDRSNELLEAGIEISSDLGEAENVGIYLTSADFRNIFGNQLTNSIWAVSGVVDKRIRIETSKDGMYLSIRWLDTGCGIDPGIRDVLYGLEVKSRRPRGKGMGCKIAGDIIRKRQGRVRVDDPPEGWSTSIVMKFIRTE